MNEELSSLGASYLCGLGLGLWKSIDDLLEIPNNKIEYNSKMDNYTRSNLYKGWINAIRSVLYLTELNNAE